MQRNGGVDRYSFKISDNHLSWVVDRILRARYHLADKFLSCTRNETAVGFARNEPRRLPEVERPAWPPDERVSCIVEKVDFSDGNLEERVAYCRVGVVAWRDVPGSRKLENNSSNSALLSLSRVENE